MNRLISAPTTIVHTPAQLAGLALRSLPESGPPAASPPRVETATLPRHVAIIMDGNGRWAQQRGLSRSEGHREGARAVRRVVTQARNRGVEVLTLYAFSAQNWRRPGAEIEALMALLIEFCHDERSLLEEQAICFRVIGQRERLSPEARGAVELLEESTIDNGAMQLLVALSYGAREELVRAARQLCAEVAAGRLSPADIDEAAVERYLWTAGVPDPDLLIRTSGELRVSNFLLWQIAYAELHVDQRLWPEFDADAFDAALTAYAGRERRFGAIQAPPDPAQAR